MSQKTVYPRAHSQSPSQRPRHRTLMAAAATAVTLTMVLAACASPRAATPTAGTEPLQISRTTNGELQAYFSAIRHNLRGVFAVSADGNSSFYYYCPAISCQSNLFGTIAIERCESLAGQSCELLYVARDPRRAYTVASDRGAPGRHASLEGRPIDEFNFFGD